MTEYLGKTKAEQMENAKCFWNDITPQEFGQNKTTFAVTESEKKVENGVLKC
jgi:hypothetical protein